MDLAFLGVGKSILNSISGIFGPSRFRCKTNFWYDGSFQKAFTWSNQFVETLMDVIQLVIVAKMSSIIPENEKHLQFLACWGFGDSDARNEINDSSVQFF